MIIICEECGKKYRIDPLKIKGKAASFKCRVCTHLIVVSKPESSPEQPEIDPRPTLASITTNIDDSSTAAMADIGRTPAKSRRRAKGLGLRTKMLLLFMVVPIILMAGASLLYLWQLETMSNLLTQESSKFVNQMAEEKVAYISAGVAMQCKLYLLSHPDLIREDFNEDIGFKSLAVQKVGMTGYTALYELPGSDGVWRTWAHVNKKIIGIDMSKLKKPLGRNFPGFWKVYIAVKEGKNSQGYYTWQDKDGKFRDKFMVCTPIAGTRFVIAATTYMDEFTGPMKQMQARAKELSDRAKLITWAVLGLTLLLIGLIVSIYGHQLTGKIKTLTDVADRISIGELGMEVKTTSKDEIGELAEAIARMQDSIRLSIERLRRRR
ncbi:MAG: zinc-ribbon domain-containing protein [Desulfobacterales bacterium]